MFVPLGSVDGLEAFERKIFHSLMNQTGELKRVLGEEVSHGANTLNKNGIFDEIARVGVNIIIT